MRAGHGLLANTVGRERRWAIIALMSYFSIVLFLVEALQVAPSRPLQQQQTPGTKPPAAAQPQRRTAVIEGVVARTSTNEPLAGAMVTVTRVSTQAAQPQAAFAVPPV